MLEPDILVGLQYFDIEDNDEGSRFEDGRKGKVTLDSNCFCQIECLPMDEQRILCRNKSLIDIITRWSVDIRKPRGIESCAPLCQMHGDTRASEAWPSSSTTTSRIGSKQGYVSQTREVHHRASGEATVEALIV